MTNDNYTKEETERRFVAALRGARLVGHKPLKDIPKRNGESRAMKGETKQRKKRR